MNRISIDLQRTLGTLDRNVFGGFAEHLERCIYGGIYDPESPHADERGLRTDVIAALRRLRMPVIRYPGGNFVSGYRWEDGVGPREKRPVRLDLAWHTTESNQFGTNEFIEFCRILGTEPYLVVNCGDGSMREARDWVEYCNGTQDTALVKLRRQHGYDAPHKVKYWGIGNEIDGPWQIGFKTPQEYARAVTEFGKVMKWVDPDIKLIANGVSHWDAADFVERGQLLLEQAAYLIDYLAIHWYVDNDTNDFSTYMALSELFEERLSAYEGLIRALRLERKIERPIYIAVDEWNVWHRAQMGVGGHDAVVYTLEDALVVAMQLNTFLRHARIVKMANIAQIVNVLAPIVTRREGLFLQTIFYAFEAYSALAGPAVLDVHWDGETFSAGDRQGLRILDVTATLDANKRELVVFVVNRSEREADTVLKLAEGQFAGPVRIHTVNGAHVKAYNSFDDPGQATTKITTAEATGSSLPITLQPHSLTALVCPVR
ncbi:MAG: alpha-L-arabinofuranosidase C-terminal domain-containing protein [Chloroflexota bacterium]